MDLWGAGINFILDGEKTKRPEKILRILGQGSKINQGMLGSLSRTGFFHTADESRSACAQNNIYDAILVMVLVCTSDIRWKNISGGRNHPSKIIFFINKIYNIILEGEIFRKI